MLSQYFFVDYFLCLFLPPPKELILKNFSSSEASFNDKWWRGSDKFQSYPKHKTDIHISRTSIFQFFSLILVPIISILFESINLKKSLLSLWFFVRILRCFTEIKREFRAFFMSTNISKRHTRRRYQVLFTYLLKKDDEFHFIIKFPVLIMTLFMLSALVTFRFVFTQLWFFSFLQLMWLNLICNVNTDVIFRYLK